MLKHMNHENVIGLLDVFTPAENFEDFQDVYLVTPLMGADLNNIIKTQKLTDDHVQFLICQILRALKILDFGLARAADYSMTGYVATRWYRAPEIMLNWMHYNHTVDIWCVGCIMAEMLTGRPLFPGTDHIDQLQRILSLVGTPSDALLEKISSAEARNYIKQLEKWEKKDFRIVIVGANPNAIDLLERMLDLDSDTWITAIQALAHPYLRQYADPSDETEAETYNQSWEDMEVSIEEWRRLVYEETANFKPHLQEPTEQMEEN